MAIDPTDPTDNLPPLRIEEKLFHMNCNIGAEGTLDCYLADVLGTEDQVVLAVFVGRYEEIAYRAVIKRDAFLKDREYTLPRILTTFKEVYLKDSIHERNCCTQLQ